MLGKIEGGRRRDDRGWDGWMASSTPWRWLWVNSGRWWWTGRPGVLQSGGHRESDTTQQLNWTELRVRAGPRPWVREMTLAFAPSISVSSFPVSVNLWNSFDFCDPLRRPRHLKKHNALLRSRSLTQESGFPGQTQNCLPVVLGSTTSPPALAPGLSEPSWEADSPRGQGQWPVPRAGRRSALQRGFRGFRGEAVRAQRSFLQRGELPSGNSLY